MKAHGTDWILILCLPALLAGSWSLVGLYLPRLGVLGSELSFLCFEFIAIPGLVFSLVAVWFAVSRTRDTNVGTWLKVREWSTWLFAIGANILNVYMIVVPKDV